MTLYVGVAPVRTIIDFYEKSKTLIPQAAEALKRQLELRTDINKCRPFLYWSSAIGNLFQ